MRKGIVGMVAVVLMVAVVIIGSIAIYSWASGVATKEPTTTKPQPLTAILISNDAGYAEVVLINLGSESIPEGTVFTVAETGSPSELTADLLPSTQTTLRFWALIDDNGEAQTFEGRATIFSAVAGISAPSIELGSTISEEGNLTYNASGGATGYDASVISAVDVNGLYWLSFSSDAEPSNSHDIFVRNSTDGLDWNAIITAATEDPVGPPTPDPSQEDTPYMILDDDGTFWIIYRSFCDGIKKLRMVNSTDGTSWSTVYHTNISFTGGGDFDYRVDNIRGFSFIKDSSDLFWIAYQYDNELIVRNSTDAGNWSAEIVVDSSTAPGRVSIIEAQSAYWIAALNQTDNDTIEVFSSSDGNSWTQTATISRSDLGYACSGPNLLYAEGHFYLFADMMNSTNQCEKIQVMASEDGEHWSQPSFLPSYSGSDLAPYSMYTNGVYWLAFGNTALKTIYTRSSTDPMIWADV